ncbi:MAG: hypothetical protein RJA98_596 [Pseudomonadota bacterium]|jgi:hypothetical protein
MKINRLYLVTLAALFAGMAQYAPTLLENIRMETVSLFSVDTENLEAAGPLRYIKEFVLLLLAMYFALGFNGATTTEQKMREMRWNFIAWIAALVGIGLIPYLLQDTPIFLLAAGLRWVLLTVGSFAIFILCAHESDDSDQQKFFAASLVILLGFDALVVVYQAVFVAQSMSVGVGASRVTGIFSNAGVGAFFSLGCALILATLQNSPIGLRLVGMLLALIISLGSGTRFAMIGLFILVIAQLREHAQNISSAYMRIVLTTLGLPLFISAGYLGYMSMIEAVGRGSLVDAQLEDGGRISNLVNAITTIFSADASEILFGRGLGVGTNTGYSMAVARSIVPESIRFNWLIDNALLTQFFQIGLLGSLLFWTGIGQLVHTSMKDPGVYGVGLRISFILIVTVNIFAGNPFEQYFLAIPYAYFIGSSYWKKCRCYAGQ